MNSEVYEKFKLEQRYRGNSDKTLEWYEENLIPFMKWLGNGELTIEAYKMYGVHLRDEVRKRNGDKLSEASIQGSLRAVKAFYGFAAEQGYIDEGIRFKLKLPKAHSKEQQILDNDEIQHLLELFDEKTELGLRNKCIVAYMLDCGLRRNEVTKINIGDIHLKHKVTVVKGKGGKQRTVPMGEMSTMLITEYVARYRKNAKDTSPLFVSEDGLRCTDNLVKQLFRRLKTSSGIARIHPHLLRHTFATYYIADGGDLETLRVILGHANIQTTQRYLHMAANLSLQRSRHKSHIDLLYGAKKALIFLRHNTVKRRKALTA